MENTSAFTLGLFTLILAVIGFLLPGYTTNPALGILGFIGTIISVIAGILLLIGGIRNSKDLSGTGFGIGMGSWGLLVLVCIISIIGLLELIASNTVYFIRAIYMSIYDPYHPSWLWLTLAIMHVFDTRYCEMAVLWDSIQIFVSGSCITLGSISFGLVIKQLTVTSQFQEQSSKFCIKCGTKIRMEAIYCEKCGAKIE